MHKDLHDIDELFRSSLEGYEETPSAGLKESLDAALDKKEAEKYKKRAIAWKRSALLLLLLLAGFVIYESGLIKKGGGNYTAKKSTPGNKTETLKQEKNSPGNSTISNIIPNQPVIQNDNITAPEASFLVENGTFFSKNKKPDNQSVLSKQNQLFSIITSPPVKKTNELSEPDTDFPKRRTGKETQDKRISLTRLTELLFKNISSLIPVAVSNSPLKANSDISNSKKVNKHFQPFWMITPFISYDQAGYKLDSDDPSAIKSIKFREANEPSYSTGLLLARQLTPKFSLQSGIVYRNTAIGMKPQKTYAFADPTGDVAYKYITSSGYAFIKPGFGPQPNVGDSLTTAEAKHTLENISVPLVARYTVSDKKISIAPGAGFEANFITKANLEVDIEDPFNKEIVVVRKLNGTKSFYWSFIADAEIKYNLNKKISLNIRPVFRTAISPITKNNVVETLPNSFGIGAGVTIKF